MKKSKIKASLKRASIIKSKRNSRRIKADTTEDEIIRAFKEHLNVDVVFQGESPWGYGWTYTSDSPADNDESEWVVFKDPEDAEREALADVKNTLESEPEGFKRDFLQNHIYITDVDRRIIAGEEADAYYDGWEDADILNEADIDMDEVDEKELEDAVEDAKQDLMEKKTKETYDALEDSINYFVEEHGMFSLEDLMKQNFIHIDEREAAKDAVDMDGVAHFLDGYDGTEEELEDPETKNDYLAYGTN